MIYIKNNKSFIFTLILALSPVALWPRGRPQVQAQENFQEITVLDGTVSLKLTISADFSHIGLRFTDKNLNRQPVFVEIKKRGKFYFFDECGGRKYTNIDDAIKDFLEDLIMRFYDRREDEKRGKEVWAAFLNEGGLQSFIDFANEVIDGEFLNSPFNKTYG